jgi:hypothetical protein
MESRFNAKMNGKERVKLERFYKEEIRGARKM